MKKSTLTQTKMLFAAFCCFALMASVKAQTFSILPSPTQSMTVTCDSMPSSNTVYIKNPTGSDIGLSYVVITNTLPSSGTWDYQFCNWENCFPSLPSGTKDVVTKIPAGTQTSSMIMDMTSNKNPGQGLFVLKVYETSVPTNSVIVTWSAKGCTSSGISEPANNTAFIVYPNPAEDFVNVEITSGYSKTGSIQVYNFVGDKIMEFNGIKNNVQRIDLTKLPAGAYFVKYYNGEGTSVKKIFKTK